MKPFPAAGWYPDPAGLPQLRWWDGAQWTGWTSNGVPTRPPQYRWQKVVLGATLLLILGMVTVFGLRGTRSEDYRAACISDVRTVEVALFAYHADKNMWPLAGPIDKNSVLLKGPTPFLGAPPSNSKYSINTDGNGGVLVAVPPARTGGINFDDAAAGRVPGVTNPCDAIK